MSSLTTTDRGPAALSRGLLIGAGLVALPVALIIAVLAFGASSHGAGGVAVAPAAPPDPYPRLLMALPVILAVCALCGTLMRKIGQPPVIGQIIAGIALGPTLLGAVWPAAFHWLFPAYLTSTINTLAQLGLIFFMYLIGSEIDLGAMRRSGAAAATIGQAGLAIPMLSGAVLAFWLYPRFGGGAGFLAFALFIAVVMSVTAFPVLARILADRGITDTPLGVLSVTCAAISDLVAWCLLALVTAVAKHGSDLAVVKTVAIALAIVLVLGFVVRPLLSAWIDRVPPGAVLPIMLGGVMLSALATNQDGIHPIFGAFAFGVIAPRRQVTREAGAKMESLTTTLLLPLFFVYTGLNSHFGLLGTHAWLWAWCALVTVVAIAGKLGACTLAARLTGSNWRAAVSLGALMNCRGLTELVVLGLGLQLHVISPTVFAMLVIMTLISTAATAPLLSLIERRRPAPA